MNKQFCGNCGSEIEPGTSFCPSCGTRVQQEAQPVQQAYPQPVPAKKPIDKKAVLGIAGGVAVLALIIVLIGGFNRMDNMARGITRYVKEHQVKIPIFTRMCGTMEQEGIAIMRENELETDYDLTDMVEKLRLAVKGV